MNIKIKNGWLIIPTAQDFEIRQGDLFIIDGKISLADNKAVIAREIDAGNRIILPAMVNAHHHIYSTLSRGIPCQVPFHDFLGNLKQLWWTLDRSLNKEDIILSTALAMQDSLKHGVTTIFDHHISGEFITGSLETMARVFQAYNVCGSLAFEISDRNGTEFFQQSLQENIAFTEKNPVADVKGMIGLHASFTLSPESLQVISRSTGNIPIHVHVAEDIYDVIHCQKHYNMGLIERFDSHDLLRDNSLLIHCSNLSEKEVDILRNRNIFVVQAVDSNLNNALNVGDISSFINHGIKTTIGTDGMTSSILKAQKNSFLLHKYLQKSPDTGFNEMKALILNGYKLKEACGFPLGIREGEIADLAVLDYIPRTRFDESTFLGHYIYGITESRVKYVIKFGQILLDDFRLTINPYQEYLERAEEISAALFRRFTRNKGKY